MASKMNFCNFADRIQDSGAMTKYPIGLQNSKGFAKTEGWKWFMSTYTDTKY